MGKTLAIIGVAVAAVVVFLVVLFFTVVSLRNNLVVKEEDVETQWAQVETEYQRRYDLIPNLVSSVRGYLEQERDILTEIADARTRYAGAESGSQERVDAANEIESALGRLLVIMENYPDLKSDQTVIVLVTQLEGTENRISIERRRYNEAVNDFNKTVRVFPNNVINDLLLHFEEKERFEAAEAAEFVPEVDLSIEEESVTPEEGGGTSGEDSTTTVQ